MANPDLQFAIRLHIRSGRPLEEILSMPSSRVTLLKAFDDLEPIGVDAGIVAAYMLAINGGEAKDPASLVRFEPEPDLTDEQAAKMIAMKWGICDG